MWNLSTRTTTDRHNRNSLWAKCMYNLFLLHHQFLNPERYHLLTTAQVRTLQSIDLSTLEIEKFPGSDLQPQYQPPETSQEPEDAEDGLKLYHGNCHCGAVTYTVKTKPLDDIEVMSCNCSLCSRVRSCLSFPCPILQTFLSANPPLSLVSAIPSTTPFPKNLEVKLTPHRTAISSSTLPKVP